jgi:putative endonuclease
MDQRYRRMLRGMKVHEEARSAYAASRWHLYILRCGDGSLYTGVTTDIERRLREHQEGKAARYTRAHRPVELVYSEECGGRSVALSRECAVKSLGRPAKDALIRGRKPAKERPKRKI